MQKNVIFVIVLTFFHEKVTSLRYYFNNYIMKKSLLTLFTALALGVCPALADVTFTVNVPAGTKQCFVVGALPELANWSAGSPVAMTKVDGKDQFTVTIAGITADDVKASEGYKYLCGPS